MNNYNRAHTCLNYGRSEKTITIYSDNRDNK